MSTKQQKTKFLFGSDPEFAIKDRENRIVSAIPILERDKHNPHDLKAGHAIYFDNVLAEARIKPATSKSDLIKKVKSLYKKSQKILKDHKLSATASHDFDIMECMHPEAMKFGCDPELDVYAGGQAYPPQGGNSFRSAGGHIHVGGMDEELTVYEKVDLVILMDILVGVPSVIMDNDPTSLRRKELYGKAGRFRNCSYGIEYRTLGNFWLSNPELTSVIYDLTMVAANIWKDGRAPEIFGLVNQAEVVECINSGNRELAKKIFAALPLDNELKAQITELSNSDYDSDIFKNWEV